MKPSKIVIGLIAVSAMLSLILVGYGIIIGFGTQDTTIENTTENTTEQPTIQILSPQENTTYQTYNVPLNIATKNATTKVIYNIGKIGESTSYVKNTTYTENTKMIDNLYIGVYNLTVYAFDAEENIIDHKTTSFTIDYPNLTQQELQETINYFKDQGLTIEPARHQLIIKGSVIFESKEEFATFVKTHGITTILEIDEPSPYVWFSIEVYSDLLPLPDTFSGLVSIYNHSRGTTPWPATYSFAVKII
jgi:hypothetical protein